MNKGDKLKNEVKVISHKIHNQKTISSLDFYEYQKVLLRSELFEELFDEFYKISTYLNQK